jgi:hypothetical protein
MQPREEEKREPQMAPEPRREEQPKPRRFRIVKLEERIAPRAAVPESHPPRCICSDPDSSCF